MRELGFSQDWWNCLKDAPKLSFYEFISFNYPRKDKDYWWGETLRIVLYPFTDKRVVLGEAKIVKIDRIRIWDITDEDARANGFPPSYDHAKGYTIDASQNMRAYLRNNFDYFKHKEMNKLTLHWQVWYESIIKSVRN